MKQVPRTIDVPSVSNVRAVPEVAPMTNVASVTHVAAVAKSVAREAHQERDGGQRKADHENGKVEFGHGSPSLHLNGVEEAIHQRRHGKQLVEQTQCLSPFRVTGELFEGL